MPRDTKGDEEYVRWRSNNLPPGWMDPPHLNMKEIRKRKQDLRIVSRMFIFWFLFIVGFAILLGVLSAFLEVSV